MPEHSLLNQVDCSEPLEEFGEERKKRFRSGIGTLMYMSQERVDMRLAIKSLASGLSCPTLNLEKCLIHAILYAAGTQDLSFRSTVQKMKG